MLSEPVVQRPDTKWNFHWSCRKSNVSVYFFRFWGLEVCNRFKLLFLLLQEVTGLTDSTVFVGQRSSQLSRFAPALVFVSVGWRKCLFFRVCTLMISLNVSDVQSVGTPSARHGTSSTAAPDAGGVPENFNVHRVNHQYLKNGKSVQCTIYIYYALFLEKRCKYSFFF